MPHTTRKQSPSRAKFIKHTKTQPYQTKRLLLGKLLNRENPTQSLKVASAQNPSGNPIPYRQFEYTKKPLIKQ